MSEFQCLSTLVSELNRLVLTWDNRGCFRGGHDGLRLDRSHKPHVLFAAVGGTDSICSIGRAGHWDAHEIEVGLGGAEAFGQQ